MNIEEVAESPDLRSWQDAWDMLDAMPPAAQASQAALRWRAVLSACLHKWDLGIDAAHILSEGGREDREIASLFFQAFALECLRDGDEEGAGLLIASAIDAWPDDRMEILCPVLEAAITAARTK